MEFTNGTLKILYIKQYGEYLPIGCLIDNSFSESADMLDTTVRTNTNGWKSSIPVGQSYSIDFSGLITNDISSDTMITFQALRDIKRQRQLLEWRVSDGNGNDDFGSAYINSLGETSTIDEFVSFNGSLVGQGEPTNTFDSLYYGYKDRVLADGGTFEAERCVKEYIEQNLL